VVHKIGPRHLWLLTDWMASNFVAALAVSHKVVPKLSAQFSILEQKKDQ
jgi:hypothetical protein